MYWQIGCGASGDWGVKRITVSSEQITGGEEVEVGSIAIVKLRDGRKILGGRDYGVKAVAGLPHSKKEGRREQTVTKLC